MDGLLWHRCQNLGKLLGNLVLRYGCRGGGSVLPAGNHGRRGVLIHIDCPPGVGDREVADVAVRVGKQDNRGFFRASAKRQKDQAQY